jgi:hypothetical protein
MTDDKEKFLEVIDVMGKTVYTQKFTGEKLNVKLNVAPGAYYARIISGENAGVKKFIVQ